MYYAMLWREISKSAWVRVHTWRKSFIMDTNPQKYVDIQNHDILNSKFLYTLRKICCLLLFDISWWYENDQFPIEFSRKLKLWDENLLEIAIFTKFSLWISIMTLYRGGNKNEINLILVALVVHNCWSDQVIIITYS